MKIEAGKTYKTFVGTKAKIIAKNPNGTFSVLHYFNDKESKSNHQIDGKLIDKDRASNEYKGMLPGDLVKRYHQRRKKNEGI